MTRDAASGLQERARLQECGIDLTGEPRDRPGIVTPRADSAQEVPSLRAGDGIAGVDTNGDAAGS